MLRRLFAAWLLLFLMFLLVPVWQNNSNCQKVNFSLSPNAQLPRLAFATTFVVQPGQALDGQLLGLMNLVYSLSTHSNLLNMKVAPFLILSNADQATQELIVQLTGGKIIQVGDLELPVNCTLPHDASHFHKLWMWGLEEFDVIVHLDTDCFVMQSVDELFEVDINLHQIAAAVDGNPPLFLNSGVVVMRPNRQKLNHMLNHLRNSVCDASINASSDWWLARVHGDQDFLQVIFSQYWVILSARYNFQQTTLLGSKMIETESRRNFINMHQQHSEFQIKIFHFTGFKPWDKFLNEWATFHQLWWDSLRNAVHKVTNKQLINKLKSIRIPKQKKLDFILDPLET